MQAGRKRKTNRENTGKKGENRAEPKADLQAWVTIPGFLSVYPGSPYLYGLLVPAQGASFVGGGNVGQILDDFLCVLSFSSPRLSPGTVRGTDTVSETHLLQLIQQEACRDAGLHTRLPGRCVCVCVCVQQV